MPLAIFIVFKLGWGVEGGMECSNLKGFFGREKIKKFNWRVMSLKLEFINKNFASLTSGRHVN